MSAIDGKVLLTKNDCYKEACKMTPKGIVVHSTGCNNPNLKRYIQPNNYNIGTNTNNNDWNRSGLDVCVHGFIGKDNDGNVKFIQTLPFNYCCWGVGSGSKGSYNYNPAYIQFEMCEDGLIDRDYCKKVYKKAVAVCAYLCKKYNISVSNIVSHKEAHDKGYGSAHVDPTNWWNNFGYTMDGFRKAVNEKLTAVKVKATKNCNLYEKAYKDPVGGAVAYIKIKKGTEMTWKSDDNAGWSKVKYNSNTYYVLNANLSKSGLSKCPTTKLAKDITVKKVKDGKIVSTSKIAKGKSVKAICKILSGQYKGYSYIKKGTSYYYAKL
jgi:N-acetylmuramoyl-L-alanine amidase